MCRGCPILQNQTCMAQEREALLGVHREALAHVRGLLSLVHHGDRVIRVADVAFASSVHCELFTSGLIRANTLAVCLEVGGRADVVHFTPLDSRNALSARPCVAETGL